jgi:exopolyphosphatase / guanosine-5'-triphosphate,3'-diphosphate pyrophosphatase
VFDGPPRAPLVLFNEKVMAGLGKGVLSTGRLDEAAIAATLPVLDRFRHIASLMGVAHPITVATAAVRQAANGSAFIDRVAALGLSVRLLSGEEEAVAAGNGVIAGFENANGIVGDLGGGSLELARVEGGQVHQRESFPLGVLRVAPIRARGPAELRMQVMRMLKAQEWASISAGLPFYLVGGSWRSLAKIHMFLARYPLPIVHHYTMPPLAAPSLVRAVARLDRGTLKERNIVSGSRYPTMADAAALLSVLTSILKPSSLIVSATGLRDGIHYGALPPEEQALDPLIVSARAEGERQGRFPEHGDLVYRWIDPLFAGETADERRLRLAACLLSDIGWAANPDFRAERGLEAALHGNWLGLDARGRAMIGQTLFSTFGGGNNRPAILSALAPVEDLQTAHLWGLALRLGQRLSGGVAEPLRHTNVSTNSRAVQLTLMPNAGPLIGEAVERRLKQLAQAMGKVPEIIRS